MYSPTVSNNEKYLFYAYGEPIEHAESFPSNSGFKSMELGSSKELFDIAGTTITGIFIHPREAIITADSPQGEFFYTFDLETEVLHKIKRDCVGARLGFHSYLNVDGDALGLSMFEIVKK